jgi:hypothetical protein
MEQANTNSKPAPLPLFRAEALAARQQGTQGEILLIRPLSLVFLGWLGVALAASAISFLLLARYTETEPIEGTITASTALQGGEMAAVLTVTTSRLSALRPGQKMRIRCRECVSSLEGTILSTSPVFSSRAGVASDHSASTLTIALPATTKLPDGTKVQAEIQLEKRPLIVWLREKPGPSPQGANTGRTGDPGP